MGDPLRAWAAPLWEALREAQGERPLSLWLNVRCSLGAWAPPFPLRFPSGRTAPYRPALVRAACLGERPRTALPWCERRASTGSARTDVGGASARTMRVVRGAGVPSTGSARTDAGVPGACFDRLRAGTGERAGCFDGATDAGVPFECLRVNGRGRATTRVAPTYSRPALRQAQGDRVSARLP